MSLSGLASFRGGAEQDDAKRVDQFDDLVDQDVDDRLIERHGISRGGKNRG